MKRIHHGLISALIYVAVMPVAAIAQTAEGGSEEAADEERTREGPEGIPEILVTAERRTAVVQSTAASVSVRTGEELAAQGKFSLRQVLDDIVGITAVENSSINPGSADVQGNNITIRGITPGGGAGAAMQISAAPATAVYVDGVYEGLGSVYDVERVEVLRGPGGTLYGRSATSGVVAFHTRNPSMDEFAVSASAEIGSYDLLHYSGAVNIPVASTLAIRVSGDYRDQGKGYFGEGDRGMRERMNGRVKLLWEPTDNLSFLLGAAYELDKSNSGGNESKISTLGVVTTITNDFFPGRKEQQQYWADVDWDLGPATLHYQGALRTWKQNDFLLQTGNFLNSGTRLLQLLDTPINRFHTQELRLASNDDSMLSWQVGAFYYKNTMQTNNRNFLADSNNDEIVLQLLTDDDKVVENIGAFAETTFSASPSLRVTLGARYDDTNITVSEYAYENDWSLCGTNLFFVPMAVLGPLGEACTGPGQASIPSEPGNTLENEKLKFNNFNYKARIEYDVADWNLLYASISTGFRPGDAGISDGEKNVLDSEKLTSIEIGSKNRFLDNTLQVNLGAYYYIYEGFQTSYQPQTCLREEDGVCVEENPNDYAAITVTPITVPARNLGFELETLYRPTPNDMFSIAYSYVQSHWHNPDPEFAASQPQNKRAMTPHTVTASYQHMFQLPGDSMLTARIDGKFEAAHLTANVHADLLDVGYDQYVYAGDRLISNAQLTWISGDGDISVSAYVRNLTNENYANKGFSDLNTLNLNYVDPRIFGVLASVNF